MQIYFNISAEDGFWKHCDNEEFIVSPFFPKIFVLYFIIMLSSKETFYKFVTVDFSHVWKDVFKVVCCRFVVCGKGEPFTL